jgi:hypothetical protein
LEKKAMKANPAKRFFVRVKVFGSLMLAAAGIVLTPPAFISAIEAVAVGAALTGTAYAASPPPYHNRHRNDHWGHFRDRGGHHGHDEDRNPAAIILAEAASSPWDDGRTVGAQLQLQNLGEDDARDVRVTRIIIDGGSYVGPETLPLSLGNLEPEEDVVFNAILNLAPINGTKHMLTVEGTFLTGQHRRPFKANGNISPTTAPPGPFNGQTGQTVKVSPSKAIYPPAPPPATFGPNAESPVFVPLGPARQIFPPTPTGTSLGTSAGSASVQIPRNTTSLTNAGFPPDPDAAAAATNGVVLSTYNTGISYSTNGGASFTDINLFAAQPGNPARTSFFPQSDGGLCCDQVVIYLPTQDLFVWLLQYQPLVNATGTAITNPNRLRVAWATPAAIAADFYNAWTYADLTGNSVTGVGDGLGTANNEWLDYPDLAWSDRFLYVGVDHGFTTPGRVYTGRRIVARLSLADMANAAASVIHYDRAELTNSNGLNKAHFIQNAPGRMVVGSLDNSSTMRIFTWADGASTIPSPTTVGITTIPQGANYTSIAPDGTDWLAVSFPGNITGGTFRNLESREEYLFAFDAGANSGGSRPNAYVRIETVTPTSAGSTSYQAAAEYDIWNNDYAYAMASLGSDGSEIGITVAVGGGSVVGYPQEAVGYRNDFVVYQVTNSNATQTSASGSRFGDYFGTRLIPGDGLFFATEVYDVLLTPGSASGSTCLSAGCSARARYVQFGRPPVVIK